MNDGEDILVQELRGYILNEGLKKALKGLALLTIGVATAYMAATSPDKVPKVGPLYNIVAAGIGGWGLMDMVEGGELIWKISV